jgi:hypothetical protein
MLNLGVGRRLRGRWRFARLPWEGGAAVACVSLCGLLGPGSLPDPILRSIHTPAGSATQLEQASRGATTAVATLGRMVDAVNAADARAYAASPRGAATSTP